MYRLRCLNVSFTWQKSILCFIGDDSDDRFCNFSYRKLFTPDLNVFPLYKSYYIYRHYRHHLAQKGRSDSYNRLTSNLQHSRHILLGEAIKKTS